MTKEILRDKTLGWMERNIFDEQRLGRFCWMVIIIASIYFMPAVIRILAR